MSDPWIHRVQIVLAGCPHGRGRVRKSRVDPGVVLGIHAETLRANLRHIGGVRRRTIADDEGLQFGHIRRIPEALPAAPAEADDPNVARAGGLHGFQIGARRIEIARHRVRVQRRDQLARGIGRAGRAAATRQQIRRDRDEAVLRELLGRLSDEVRHAEDLVNDDDCRRGLRALGIGDVRRDGVFAAEVLNVLGVNVGSIMGRRHQ